MPIFFQQAFLTVNTALSSKTEIQKNDKENQLPHDNATNKMDLFKTTEVIYFSFFDKHFFTHTLIYIH
jgi:hypothetical protein